MGKDDMRFAATLQALLEARSLSQADLARAIGTSRAYVNSVVRGQKPLSPAKIEEIAGSLGATKADRVRLHRAAALDQGFNLDLPEDF